MDFSYDICMILERKTQQDRASSKGSGVENKQKGKIMKINKYKNGIQNVLIGEVFYELDKFCQKRD